MKVVAAILALIGSSSYAADGFVCPGDPKVRELAGYYAHATVIEAAPRLRSWAAVMSAVESDKAGLIVRDGEVFLSRSWHEGDTGGHCVRQDEKGLWVREAISPSVLHGPYRRVAALSEREALAYLTLFMKGCYSSSDGKRWCFSRRDVTVDGKSFNGEFELDTMEFPEYGTSFRVSGASLPLIVFAPLASGWAAYEDDFVTTEGRVPVVPGRTKPLFVLSLEVGR